MGCVACPEGSARVETTTHTMRKSGGGDGDGGGIRGRLVSVGEEGMEDEGFAMLADEQHMRLHTYVHRSLWCKTCLPIS